LAVRVATLEGKVGSKTTKEQFREQAELIDTLSLYRLAEMDKKWDEGLDRKLDSIQADLTAVREAVKIVVTRLS